MRGDQHDRFVRGERRQIDIAHAPPFLLTAPVDPRGGGLFLKKSLVRRIDFGPSRFIAVNDGSRAKPLQSASTKANRIRFEIPLCPMWPKRPQAWKLVRRRCGETDHVLAAANSSVGSEQRLRFQNPD